MSWLAFVPVVAVAGAALWAPGAVLGWALRLRGLKWVATAPPLSISLIAVASICAGLVGVRWSIVPVVVLTLIAAAAAWGWTRWLGPQAPPRDELRRGGRGGAILVAVLLGVFAISAIVVSGIRDPQFFSQRYDNFFHLNAVQFILDTGNASPLWIGNMTSPDGTLPFYPSAWHAIVSLVVQFTGASIVASTNATILVVAAIIWPIGCIFMARTMLGRGAVVTVASGVLASAFSAYPYLPLHYGVLYPLFLGLAAVPAVMSTLWTLLRPAPVPRRWDVALLAVLLLPGVALAHPGAFLAVLALSVPMVMGSLLSWARRGSRRARVFAGIGVLAYIASGVLVLRVVRPPADQIYWPKIESIPASIGAVVSAAPYGYPLAIVPAFLFVVGAYSVVRRPTYTRWLLLCSAAIGGVLYIVVAAAPSETLRNWLTGPWYNNAPRLASIWVIGALPIAVLGADSLVRALGRVRRLKRARAYASRRPVASAAVFGCVLLVIAQGPALKQAGADIGFTYQMRADAPIVTQDELNVMNRLKEAVPGDAVIAGDPYTGASFAYALSGRKVLMPHLLMQVSAQARLINAEFASQGNSPAMCGALRDTGVRYILDFSAHGDFMANNANFDGLKGLDRSPYVKIVDAEDGAKLYRITSCGFGS